MSTDTPPLTHTNIHGFVFRHKKIILLFTKLTTSMTSVLTMCKAFSVKSSFIQNTYIVSARKDIGTQESRVQSCREAARKQC